MYDDWWVGQPIFWPKNLILFLYNFEFKNFDFILTYKFYAFANAKFIQH